MTRSYIRFVNVGLPWHEEAILYVQQDAEPRHIVPMLGKVRTALAGTPDAREAKWPHRATLATICANHVIVADPMNIFHHARVLIAESAKELPADDPVTRVDRFIPPPDRSVEYLYDIACVCAEARSDTEHPWYPAWYVEISVPAEDYRVLPSWGKFKVVHTRRSLTSMIEHMDRLRSFHELGGTVEYF